MLINTSAQDLVFMCLLEEGHGAGERDGISNEHRGQLSCWLSAGMAVCAQRHMALFSDGKRREILLRAMTASFYS